MALELSIDEVAAAGRVGRTLRGKWRLDALIDVGGMAAVYAATHRNGMRGAVKILHPEATRNEEAKARFLREGYIANKITHPGAVRVIDDDVAEDGSLFVVMELLEGATLQECAGASGGAVPAEEVLLITEQLLDILAAIHEFGIVHRDVKPENVFVTTDGSVKVLDFGIAGIREPAAGARPVTIAGLLMGSPAYMPPEQARGRWDVVDARSDLWSVGATMFCLLAGRAPRTEETVPELLAAAITTPLPPLGEVVPGVPPAIAAIVDRAVRMDPGERWPTARAMQTAVREVHRALYEAHPLPLPGHAARPTSAEPETRVVEECA